MTDLAAPNSAAGPNLAWRRRGRALAGAWREYRRNRAGLVGLALLVIIVALALLAPVLTNANDLNVTLVNGPTLAPPSGAYWLGTDDAGRSVLLLLWWGARISLLVGLAAAALAVGIGTLVGLLTAHFGGWIAAVLLRVTDFFLVMPALVLAIALSTVLNQGLGTIVLAIGLTAWPSTARIVRAQALTIETRPYIERARALGGGHWHVIIRHVLPGVAPLILANVTLAVANAVFYESTLAFLGLGDPTAVSWGSMLNEAWNTGAVTAGAWWYILPPGFAIVVVVLTFMLCGRSLEVAINPRLRSRGRA